MMTALSMEQFRGFVEQWLIDEASRVKYMWRLQGGWEAWAQAEIVAYIVKKNSTYDIQREILVFEGSKKKCDILLNSASDDESKIIVELKCQSHGNSGAFGPGLLEDAEKLGKTALKEAYAKAQKYCIGIYFTDALSISETFATLILDDVEVGLCWRKVG